MKNWKKGLALCLAAVLAAALSACSIPKPGFADYDVSAYVQALLDSSYHDSHGDLVEITGVSEEDAIANNTTTVENAAVRFCNTYGIYPSDEQLQELEVVMKQAFALTKYTVKEERKVENGYYLEVEIASITNFEGREEDIAGLKAAAEAEASGAGAIQPSSQAGDSSSQVSSEPEPPAPAGETVNAEDLFVEKVLEFCVRELNNVSYDSDTRTMPLDILQTEEGELQMDMDQIEKIDQAVIRFS